MVQKTIISFEEKLGSNEISLLRERLISDNSGTGGDSVIKENRMVNLKVTVPGNHSDGRSYRSAILMFHGLNERSWQKYEPWAEYLSLYTDVPVVLFPISFHIDRSPRDWSDPRKMQPLVREEIEKNIFAGNVNENLTFANYALSSRIKRNPVRFYIAGRETIYNVCQFMSDVANGAYPLFDKECMFNIFSYSIGSLLSQVLIMSNPGGFFKQSRLFMFCGGSLFAQMNGNSRMIMDKISFERLHQFYRNDFLKLYNCGLLGEDIVPEAFVAHIEKSILKSKRDKFYKENHDRIRVVALTGDKVIPADGIRAALGPSWKSLLKEIDFPFGYSHEIPFPQDGKGDRNQITRSFRKVFSSAARFLKH